MLILVHQQPQCMKGAVEKIDTLNDLSEKASAQVDDARKIEKVDIRNFGMRKQSLVDEIKYANKELGEAKKAIAECGEKKAIAEGDLDVTSKELSSDIQVARADGGAPGTP